MPGKIFPHFAPKRRLNSLFEKPPPFKENDLFRGVPAWSNKNACVGDNGGPYDLYDYADAYFDATRGLLELALEAPNLKRPWVTIDLLVYPICMNFRHAVELFLKYLITAVAKKNGSNDRYRTNHSLEDNWNTAIKLIRASKLQVTDQEIEILAKVVKSIQEVDPKGEIFRYPESIKGDQHLKDWSLINLRLLDHYREETDKAAYRWMKLIEG
jgi:hypothetical protein